MTKKLTFETANRLISYDPISGNLSWKEDRQGGVKTGDKFGHITWKGYVGGTVDQVPIEGHRLAWLLHYGEFPPVGLYIDHINRNPSDNRIANLRIVDADGNAANRVRESYKHGGERGIAFNKVSSKWQVSVPITKRKSKYIGCFEDIRDARIARDAAERVVRIMQETAA